MKTFALLSCFSLLVGVGYAQDAPSPRIIVYYPAWNIYNDQPYVLADMPADRVTDINYAFVDISPTLECALMDPWADVEMPFPNDSADQAVKGNLHQLILLKQRYPTLHVVLSIGGASNSGRFSAASQTDTSRARFVHSCVVLMQSYGFDGLDIDWEFPVVGTEPDFIPHTEDKQNYTRLLEAFRQALDATGLQYSLSVALPIDVDLSSKLELERFTIPLDWVNLMGYDVAGDWSETTTHLAPLFGAISDDMAVTLLLNAGVPPQKIVIGVPFYGIEWSHIASDQHGFGQAITHDGSMRYMDYKDIVREASTSIAYWDEQSQATWLYDANRATFITYDSPRAIQAKAHYVRLHGLGGMMVWEITQDNSHTLLTTLNTALREQPSLP